MQFAEKPFLRIGSHWTTGTCEDDMMALNPEYLKRLTYKGNTQVVGEDIPPIRSFLDLKSGVRAKLVDRSGSMVIVEVGHKLVVELREIGIEAEYWRADVRHEDDVRDLIDKTVKRFGRLDIAVNNAGTEGKAGPVTEQTAESYAATFDTNVLGTLLSMKHELRVMLPQGSGSIVNISSAYGSVGAPGAAVYVASKHAVEGM